MKDIFAPIYENDLFGIYDVRYNLIFQTLYDDGGYIYFGITFIFIPLACWLLFYFAWRYPYGKSLHWLLWMFIVIVIVFVSTWSIANTEIFASNNQMLIDALNDYEMGYKDFASSLPKKYGIINSIMALLLGFIYALLMKQFSKTQTHLPF